MKNLMMSFAVLCIGSLALVSECKASEFEGIGKNQVICIENHLDTDVPCLEFRIDAHLEPCFIINTICQWQPVFDEHVTKENIESADVWFWPHSFS